MNNLIIIGILVIIAMTAVGGIFLFKLTGPARHVTEVVQPGNLSDTNTSAVPALLPGSVYSVITPLSNTGFTVYNVSGYKDYVISPGNVGSLTLNVTRAIAGGTSTNYTNPLPMNITDTGGFGFYSSANQTFPEEGSYATFIPYANITNSTANYYCSGNSCQPAIEMTVFGFQGFVPSPPVTGITCGVNKLNISLFNDLGYSALVKGATAYIYVTENNGTLKRSNMTLSALANNSIISGAGELFSFTGSACGTDAKNYSFYASINYSQFGSNLTQLSKGEVKGNAPQPVPKNGFEVKLYVPLLSNNKGAPVLKNFSGGTPNNVSAFFTSETLADFFMSGVSVSNNSGIINATFTANVPIYMVHPGISVSANPLFRVLSVNQSGSFDSTFNIASNATKGTYWMYSKVSGQSGLFSYASYYLLTIGNTPYNGSLPSPPVYS